MQSIALWMQPSMRMITYTITQNLFHSNCMCCLQCQITRCKVYLLEEWSKQACSTLFTTGKVVIDRILYSNGQSVVAVYLSSNGMWWESISALHSNSHCDGEW